MHGVGEGGGGAGGDGVAQHSAELEIGAESRAFQRMLSPHAADQLCAPPVPRFTLGSLLLQASSQEQHRHRLLPSLYRHPVATACTDLRHLLLALT